MQFFYKRKIKKNNVVKDQVIKCKIKGLRWDARKQYIERKAREKSDPGEGSTLVKITGCEYKITEERLNEVLSHWGVLSSKIMEEVFHDPYNMESSKEMGFF